MEPLAGVRRLREQRGDQQIPFWQVADHLQDYADRHPDQAELVSALGSFLADVEHRAHDHRADPDRSG